MSHALTYATLFYFFKCLPQGKFSRESSRVKLSNHLLLTFCIRYTMVQRFVDNHKLDSKCFCALSGSIIVSVVVFAPDEGNSVPPCMAC
jgi:hypothetical protein